jgi:hypothetical protein
MAHINLPSRVSALVIFAIAGCSADPGSGNGGSGGSVLPGSGDGEQPGVASPGSARGAADPSVAVPTFSGAAAGSGAASGAGPAPSGSLFGVGGASSASGGASSSGGPAFGGSAGSLSAPPPVTSVPGAPPAVPGGSAGLPPAAVPPGLLTAGAWDDNRNFDRFLAYRSSLVTAQLPGLLPFTTAEHRAAHADFANLGGPRQTLDVAFVIDTTGSMGDEIAYLQSEFLSISSTIRSRYPNAAQRWSLVLYRDDDPGDEYVTRWFDFRADPVEFQKHLAAQSAGGGGDFPESPEHGFERLNDLAWRTGSDTARLAFWVADAPHHEAKAGAMADALRATRSLGIHVYPVAASGVDELTEVSMRSAAQLTGGRYLFLTNDSGIGGDHKEPTIPCYFVTHLDVALLRMVDIEMSGTYREPAPSEIIRTGGDPRSGACTLASGEVTVVF